MLAFRWVIEAQGRGSLHLHNPVVDRQVRCAASQHHSERSRAVQGASVSMDEGVRGGNGGHDAKFRTSTAAHVR